MPIPTTHIITIESVGGIARVEPSIQHLRAGDYVQFELVEFDEGHVFLFAPTLFDRLHLPIPNEALEVQPARKGAYPYFAVVRRFATASHGSEERVAEGNSMPVFVMD